MHLVPLDRPPRRPAGAVTDRVRRAVLASAGQLGLDAEQLLDLHGKAEHLASRADLMADVEERYGFEEGTLLNQHRDLLAGIAAASGRASHGARTEMMAEVVLLALPDSEFLTVLEHCVVEGFRGDHLNAGMAEELFRAADGALRAHGAPYRRATNAFRFDWVGDPAQRGLTVGPALLALADSRLGGPRGEFEEALRKRRLGAAKDLEDAIDEAAKAVESTLQVLHDEHSVTRTGKEPLQALFNSLAKAQIVPPYLLNLVTAVGGPRNAMAAHGQGAMVRAVPEELADASIAAAATAITLLAHYLP